MQSLWGKDLMNLGCVPVGFLSSNLLLWWHRPVLFLGSTAELMQVTEIKSPTTLPQPLFGAELQFNLKM